MHNWGFGCMPCRRRYEMPPSRRPAPLLQLIKLLLTCDSELRPDITAVLSMVDQASDMPGASHSQM